jgi:hypothetical protein
MRWYEQSGGFQGSAAVNRRLQSPFARGDGDLPLLNMFKGGDPGSKLSQSGECRLISGGAVFSPWASCRPC